MVRAGASMLGGNTTGQASGAGMQGTSSNQSLNNKLPYSFKSALDQIEEEILMLAAEVSFCKKEVFI